MARLNVFHAHTSKDITCLSSINLVTLIGVHLNHASDPLSFSSRRVQNRVAFLNLSRINADKGEGAKTIIHNLEGQSPERLFDRYYGLLTRGVTLFVGQILRIHFSRAWQVINNRVQYQLDTLVLKRRATISGEEMELTSTLTDAAFDIVQ